jgi:pimeloyl-ACP methyl ester carboxylesterase
MQRLIEHAPQRVERVIFVVPGGFANGNPWQSMRKLFFPLFLYKVFGKDTHLERFLSAFHTRIDDYFFRFMKALQDHVVMDLSLPPLIKAGDYAGFGQPVDLILVETDVFFPKEKVMKKAREVFSGLGRMEVLPGEKHIPSTASHSQIEQLVERFLSE